MWLVYLRFEDQGQVKTYHLRTGSKAGVNALIALAERHGLTPSATLVEYAAFLASGTMKLKPMIAPNFHFYLDTAFLATWQAADRLLPAERQLRNIPFFLVASATDG